MDLLAKDAGRFVQDWVLAVHCKEISIKTWKISTEVCNPRQAWKKYSQRLLDHGVVKQTQLRVSFTVVRLQNGSFETQQSLFLSSPVVMSLKYLPKKYYLKNKRQRWVFCKEFTKWQFAMKYYTTVKS